MKNTVGENFSRLLSDPSMKMNLEFLRDKLAEENNHFQFPNNCDPSEALEVLYGLFKDCHIFNDMVIQQFRVTTCPNCMNFIKNDIQDESSAPVLLTFRYEDIENNNDVQSILNSYLSNKVDQGLTKCNNCDDFVNMNSKIAIGSCGNNLILKMCPNEEIDQQNMNLARLSIKEVVPNTTIQFKFLS